MSKEGFSNIQFTPASGDQGVDIIATGNGERYAIQCKRYNRSLSNKPVQEVFAGKVIYGCSKALVITNAYFTKGAREAASATGVILWDRDTLRSLTRERNKRVMEYDKTIKRIQAQPEDIFPPNPNAWPHCAVPDIDIRYYMDLPHVDYIEGQKKFVKMYMLAKGEPTGNDIVELVSEPFDTDEEALHFAKALEKHCYAITKVEDQKVFAMAHYYSIFANGIESDFEYYTFANWA